LKSIEKRKKLEIEPQLKKYLVIFLKIKKPEEHKVK